VPSGGLFLLLGIILMLMGALSPARAPMTEANVNLYTGLAMTIFGGSMLWLARKARS
jgi:hypothetical protein